MNNAPTNHFKDRIAAGTTVYSMTARSLQSIEIVAIAKAAGYDALYVDLEHSSISLYACSQICIAALATGVTPLVRVASQTEEAIGQILDGGALGIIAPHVSDAIQARRVVEAARFPPAGRRSYAGLLPHFGYLKSDPREEMELLNQATQVIVMIETEEALANADAIAAVPGVDMLMIGTNDLCADMGIAGQLEHEKVFHAYDKVIAACRTYGKATGVGGLAAHPAAATRLVRAGAIYISVAHDLGLLRNAAEQALARMRGGDA